MGDYRSLPATAKPFAEVKSYRHPIPPGNIVAALSMIASKPLYRMMLDGAEVTEGDAMGFNMGRHAFFSLRLHLVELPVIHKLSSVICLI